MLIGGFLVAGLCSCGSGEHQSPTTAQAPSASTSRPPSATEVFHLRSECARLGEKILDGNLIGPALTQSQLSHYDPKTNRCYVKLTVNRADSFKPYYEGSFLYDGQTGELLAAYEIDRAKGDSKNGSNFTDGVFTYESAREYVDRMMKEER
jgi:hypothetical protein